MSSQHVPSSKRTLIGTGPVSQVVRRPAPRRPGATQIGGMGITSLNLPEPAPASAAPMSLNTWAFGDAARIDRLHRQDVISANDLPVVRYDIALIGAVVAVATLGFLALAMMLQLAI